LENKNRRNIRREFQEKFIIEEIENKSSIYQKLDVIFKEEKI